MPEGKIAAVVETGFEDVELLYPRWRLMAAGHHVDVLTPDGHPREGKKGYKVDADDAIGRANVNDYAALLIPGGLTGPDKLRMNADAVAFVRDFVTGTDKPVFSICHGPWMLAEADVLNGVTMTSYWSIRKDLEHAGAKWRDEPVVDAGRFVTSRYPEDLPHFGEALVRKMEAHAGRAAEAGVPPTP